jgi:hypothetical protein
LGFRCTVLAPTAVAKANLKFYKDMLDMSRRPADTTQAALDAMVHLAGAGAAATASDADTETAAEKAVALEKAAADAKTAAEKAGDELHLSLASKKTDGEADAATKTTVDGVDMSEL